MLWNFELHSPQPIEAMASLKTPMPMASPSTIEGWQTLRWKGICSTSVLGISVYNCYLDFFSFENRSEI